MGRCWHHLDANTPRKRLLWTLAVSPELCRSRPSLATGKTPTGETYSPPPRQELCFVFPAPPFNLIHVCRESRGHIIKHESYRRLCLSKVPDEPYALINFDIDILDAGLFTVDYFLRLVLLSVA